MNQKELKLILEDVKSFPSMPAAAMKLLTLLKDESTSNAQIEQILRYEPGLTANILKMTNSAFFGLPSKIGSIRQAILLIGWKKLVQIVLASCVSAIIDKPVQGYDLTAGDLWRHSVGVSVASEILVKELKISVSEEVFTAALLHDVGKMVLGRYVKEDIAVIDGDEMQDVPFEQVERSMFGIDHAEIGANILRRWSFPPAMISAVKWHHDPDAAPKPNHLIDVVHVADVLCLMSGIGVGREGLQYRPSPAACERIGLTEGLLEKVASQTLLWANDLAASLQADA
ncbi:MAG: HDOD domain-containing protein [Desulfatirhabdiaceae bacterium]|nr:HDOD domain-containing protein [Desulfatirhabdiaceae bacterium]